ncbi:MAG: tRNA (adenosine(37)-N6)-threonylcarbamoyltransferase complex dimerization subunit type 1 TsaB [Lachnospiraceae bacterium]|nr:tRNA (adenosine(37)-N6)-threonylcarbamoyltransferase complex dimerization subunit type 1 TsaB [Lachnospiraceae bacterium]
MKILALDSSSLVASVAVVTDAVLTAEYTINFKKTHSQTLLPMIDEVAKMIELDLDTIDAVAVAAGPGSFTGLRIGSATAKGLGLALEKPLIGVPTIDAMAYGLFGCADLVVPIMDAKREQVYTGIYRFLAQDGAYRMETLCPQCVMGIAELFAELNQRGERVMFTGDGILVYQKQIEEMLQTEYCFAPPHLNRQRAGAVGALAEIYFAEGKTESAADHKPNYLRLSQAERERKEREERGRV